MSEASHSGCGGVDVAGLAVPMTRHSLRGSCTKSGVGAERQCRTMNRLLLIAKLNQCLLTYPVNDSFSRVAREYGCCHWKGCGLPCRCWAYFIHFHVIEWRLGFSFQLLAARTKILQVCYGHCAKTGVHRNSMLQQPHSRVECSR